MSACSAKLRVRYVALAILIITGSFRAVLDFVDRTRLTLEGGQVLVVDSEKTLMNHTSSSGTFRLNNSQASYNGDDVLNRTMEIPRNLRLVFVGDSMTRYMYLSLVYFLRFGRWVDPNERPNFVVEKTHESWWHFNKYTNSLLKPYEACDCYRPETTRYLQIVSKVRENRFYWNPEQNNSVVYLQKWGQYPMRLTWPAQDVHNGTPRELHTSLPEPYMEGHEPKIIREYIPKLRPRPSIVILNGGMWDHHGLEKKQKQDQIIDAFARTNMTSIYKTTTKRKDDNSTGPHAPYENILCQRLQYCLNLSWTGAIVEDKYADTGHLLEPMYKRMNFHLFDLLESLQ